VSEGFRASPRAPVTSGVVEAISVEPRMWRASSPGGYSVPAGPAGQQALKAPTYQLGRVRLAPLASSTCYSRIRGDPSVSARRGAVYTTACGAASTLWHHQLNTPVRAWSGTPAPSWEVLR